MFIGAHSILFSPKADELRAFFRDVLELDSVDAGHGWLIFALPPAEVGVHPAETGAHQLSLTCDDLDTTVAELRTKGLDVRDERHEERWGVITYIDLPGGLELMLYEPRHPLAR